MYSQFKVLQSLETGAKWLRCVFDPATRLHVIKRVKVMVYASVDIIELDSSEDEEPVKVQYLIHSSNMILTIPPATRSLLSLYQYPYVDFK